MSEKKIAIFVEYAELTRREVEFTLSIRDLTFYRGELAYIAGENGSGKSTLMEMLALKIKPQAGKIWIEGVQIIGLSEKEKSELMGGGITFIPQNGMGLNAANPVDNITPILLDFDGKDERHAFRVAQDALEQAGLTKEYYSRSIKELSGGQKARVAVAKAIAGERPIILADEIFKEIDPASVLHILRLFQDLARRGHAIIIIGHLPKEHEQYFHRIVRMDNGRIVNNLAKTATPAPAFPDHTSPPSNRMPHRSGVARGLQRVPGGALLLLAMVLIILFLWKHQLSPFTDQHPTPIALVQGPAAPTARLVQATVIPTTAPSGRPTRAGAPVDGNAGPPTAMPSTTLVTMPDPPTVVPSASLANAPTTTGTIPPSAAANTLVATAPPSQPSIPTTAGQAPLTGESPRIVPGGPPTTGAQAPPVGESTLVVSDGPPTTTSGSATTLAQLLPGTSEVPNGMVVIDEGSRSAADIAAESSDPADAAQHLAAWGFQENLYRTFQAPDGSVSPDATYHIEVSLHQFADASGAAQALTYYADDRAQQLGLHDVQVPPMGDSSWAIAGPLSNGNETTLYVQKGAVVIRLTGWSQTGDPTADVIQLMQTMLASSA